MFKLIKKFFAITPKYGMGALESPDDLRNIQLATFQMPVSIPEEMETELPPVENQGQIGKCVGCAIHKIAELKLSTPGKEWINLSDDDLYEQCKLIDGIPLVSGTYPSVGAKVITKNGVATVEAYNTHDQLKINESREKNKLSGYAFVASDFESICQAIAQNGAIIGVVSVGTDWFIGKITKILSSIGRHCIVFNGYKYSTKTLKGQNSWGTSWIGYIAGIINPKVKPGRFEMLWNDYKDNIGDLIAFTYVPPEILEDVKNKNFIFTKSMKIGMTDFQVQKLQERLGVKPTTGYFGNITKNAVINFQRENGIYGDGYVGPLTLSKLNGSEKISKLDAWCEAIKQMEGAKPYRNNPGNLKYVGQTYAVNDKGFCKFDTYEHGYNALKSLLIRACTGQSGVYRPTMTLHEFYQVYAPASDNNNPLAYAHFVAQKIGCSVDTLIKNLI